MDKAEFDKRIKMIDLQVEAANGFIAISNYLSEAPNLTKEAVDAFYVLKDWFFKNE